MSMISSLFNLYKTFIVLLLDEWNIWWQLHTLSSFIWWLFYLTCLIIVFRISFYISSDKCLLDCKWRWLWCWKLAVCDNSGITFMSVGARTHAWWRLLSTVSGRHTAGCYISVICVTSARGKRVVQVLS